MKSTPLNLDGADIGENDLGVVVIGNRRYNTVDAEAFERLLEAVREVESYIRVGFQAHSTADRLKHALAPFQDDEYAGVVEAMCQAHNQERGWDSPGTLDRKGMRAALDAYLTYDGPKPMPRKEDAKG